MTVLRTRGVETESELAFAALHDLLAPITGDLGALPAPQSAALAAALAVGPPAPGDRLAVCVATLGLLRVATRRRPVVAVVDDVQWLDASSRECLLYAAERAGGAVAFALAAREWPDPAQGSRIERIRLEPLTADAARALLRAASPDLVPDVAAAILDAAAGNPLALRELATTLTSEQRAGSAPLQLPLAPGFRLQAAYGSRVEALAPAVRQVLVLAAAYAGDDLGVLTAACAAGGLRVDALPRAEDAGIVRLHDGRLTFAHPLVRGAVWAQATAGQRRGAHAALAAVLTGEQRAWHLAGAVIGPQEDVAAELERAGAEAAARRAFSSASATLERAARLSPAADAVARRLVAAGHAAGAAGAPQRAAALFGEASDAAVDPVVRSHAVHARGRLMVWSGRPEEAVRLLEREAQGAARHDRVLAAAILADAANGCTNANAYLRAEALARRAAELLGDAGDPQARACVLTVLGWILVLRGQAPDGRRVLETARRIARDLDPLGEHWPWLHVQLRALIPLEALEQARAESTVLIRRAGDAGALTTLAGALLVAAEAHYRLGDWVAADRDTAAAVRVTGDTRQVAWRGFALCTRARLLAAQGRERESRAMVGEALETAQTHAISSGLRFVHGTLGFGALSAGRPAEAVTELEAVERIVAGSGLEEPTLVPWLADLIEAYVRCGRDDDARQRVGRLERQADTSGTAFAAAVAARGRGMLEADFDAAFASALDHDRARPMPFERARTLLAYGRRLHRTRRRADARDRLREALAGFERLGAAAWAAEAQHELRAAGAHRRGPRADGLTAQERRVAAAVRRGATNRQIAEELFLAPKTIDFHLRQIYRKLGVHSRTQLVAELARREVAQPRV